MFTKTKLITLSCATALVLTFGMGCSKKNDSAKKAQTPDDVVVPGTDFKVPGGGRYSSNKIGTTMMHTYEYTKDMARGLLMLSLKSSIKENGWTKLKRDDEKGRIKLVIKKGDTILRMSLIKAGPKMSNLMIFVLKKK